MQISLSEVSVNRKLTSKEAVIPINAFLGGSLVLACLSPNKRMHLFNISGDQETLSFIGDRELEASMKVGD